jgi:hypothetical protein
MITSIRAPDDPCHWNLITLSISALGLPLAGLLVYSAAHFVLW